MFNKRKLTKELEEYLLANQQIIYRLAYSYVKNPEDALDITQEAVFKAISGADSLKNPEGMKTWVYRIVSNTALDFLRKEKRLVIMDEETIGSYLEKSVVNLDEGQDLDLAMAMEKLSPRERGRIILRYFEDLKIEEVAEVLNENINTTKSRLYATLRKLRLEMAEPTQEVKHG